MGATPRGRGQRARPVALSERRRTERAAEPLRWALADWLFYRRLSGREIARRSHVARSTIQRLASGHGRAVDLRILASLCRALDVTPGDLLVWHGDDPLPAGARERARQLRLPGRAWR